MLLAVEAHDGVRKIGEGTHRRGAVNLESFAKRLAADRRCNASAASRP